MGDGAGRHPLIVVQLVHLAVEDRLPAWPEELHHQGLSTRVGSSAIRQIEGLDHEKG